MRRWTSALRARVELACSQQLLRYTKMLGGVDRFNKMLVATRMGDPHPHLHPHRSPLTTHLSPFTLTITLTLTLTLTPTLTQTLTNT